jgi:hypothetical protein
MNATNWLITVVKNAQPLLHILRGSRFRPDYLIQRVMELGNLDQQLLTAKVVPERNLVKIQYDRGIASCKRAYLTIFYAFCI